MERELDIEKAASVALGGACLATLGDLLQLHVASEGARYPDGFLPALLLVGTILGVLGIPLYSWGYRARARIAPGTARFWRMAVGQGGSLFAAIGAAVHGATGVFLSLDPDRGRDLTPYQGILASGPILVSLWAIASVTFLIAGLAELRLCESWRERAVNPLILTVSILLASSALPPDYERLIGPASVNIAHVVFFGFHLRRGFHR